MVFLMDDQVLVEPLIGCRPFPSAALTEEGTNGALGEHSRNEEKDACFTAHGRPRWPSLG